MDTLSLFSSLSRRNFYRATRGYCTGCVDDVGLEFAIFPMEPLAVAQRIEAVFRDGSLRWDWE
jgi:hypothetical protein